MFWTAAWCSGARRVADQRNRRSAGGRGVGETGFEVGDAPVLEAQGEAGGFEALVEGAVVGGELPDALFECGVLGGDALDRILSPLGFQVSDAAEEFSDTRALGEDFGVGDFECVLGVEGAWPARLIRVVEFGGELLVALAVLPDGVGRLSARHARRPWCLPPRDEPLARLERAVADLLAQVPAGKDRRALAAYATWPVLHRARRRTRTRPTPITSPGTRPCTCAPRSRCWNGCAATTSGSTS